MSTQSILLERDGTAPVEGFSIKNWKSYKPTMEDLSRYRSGVDDMIDVGKRSGGYNPCNGTTNEAKVMTEAGVAATLIEKPTLDQIATALDEGKAVVVAYDARPIWEGPDPDAWSSPTAFGHAVRPTGVDRGPDGSVRGFWINDSGDGSAGAYVDAATMKMALDGFKGGRMSVSDAPILPAVK